MPPSQDFSYHCSRESTHDSLPAIVAYLVPWVLPLVSQSLPQKRNSEHDKPLSTHCQWLSIFLRRILRSFKLALKVQCELPSVSSLSVCQCPSSPQLWPEDRKKARWLPTLSTSCQLTTLSGSLLPVTSGWLHPSFP